MTVTRQKINQFQAPLEAVIAAVRAVLSARAASYHYEQVGYDPQGRVFTAVIKPAGWPLILSTDFSVTLLPGAATVTVNAQTHSQSLILGDALNYYEGYLNDFQNALTLALASN